MVSATTSALTAYSMYYGLVNTSGLHDRAVLSCVLSLAHAHAGLYAYMYVWSSHIAREEYQPRSAEQGKMIFPCSRSCLRIWSRETGSAVPSRVSLLVSILRLNLVLTYGIPPEFRDGVHFFFFTAIRHRVIPEFIGSRNCVPVAFTAESPPAQGQ